MFVKEDLDWSSLKWKWHFDEIIITDEYVVKIMAFPAQWCDLVPWWILTTGFQIKIFLWESDGSLWLQMLGVCQKFWGLISFNSVSASYFYGETWIPKCTSSGDMLKNMGCTDPQPFIWKHVPIFFQVEFLAFWQPCNLPSACKASLKNMGNISHEPNKIYKYSTTSPNKRKQNKTMTIFYGIYSLSQLTQVSL